MKAVTSYRTPHWPRQRQQIFSLHTAFYSKLIPELCMLTIPSHPDGNRIAFTLPDSRHFMLIIAVAHESDQHSCLGNDLLLQRRKAQNPALIVDTGIIQVEQSRAVMI